MADWDRNRDDDRSRTYDRDRNRGSDLSSNRMEHSDRDRDRDFGRFEQDRYRSYGQDRERDFSRDRGQQDWNRSWNQDRNWNQDWNRNQEWDRGREQGRPFGGSDWDRSWTGDTAHRGREMMRGQGYQGYQGYGYGSGSGMEGLTGRTGSFTGRGPKGWQRSDERIREDLNERLSDHPDIDASEIEVTVSNGEVTLRGTVDNRHEKRLAEDLAENVRGVKDVHNEVKVSRSLWQKLTGQGEEEQTDRPATERGARAGAIGGQGTTGTGTKRS